MLYANRISKREHTTRRGIRATFTVLLVACFLIGPTTNASARGRGQGQGQRHHEQKRADRAPSHIERGHHNRHGQQRRNHGQVRHRSHRHHRHARKPARWVPIERYHGRHLRRDHRRHYLHGSHHGYSVDRHVWPWLAFTAITLSVLDHAAEASQRKHEEAQWRATGVPVGESIVWESEEAHGSVTPVRDGRDASGRYCREFQHEIQVGGETETGFGTACQSPDGQWEIVDPATAP